MTTFDQWRAECAAARARRPHTPDVEAWLEREAREILG